MGQEIKLQGIKFSLTIPEIFSLESISSLLNPPPQAIQDRETREELTIDQDIKKTFNISLPNFSIPILEPKAEILPYCPVDTRNEVAPRFGTITVKQSLHQKLQRKIKMNDNTGIPDNFEPVRKSPKIENPMYYPLSKLSLDFILPGVGELENNIIFLMEENRKFIESYMVGLNHEMNRELVWREYPTDQKSTIFEHFWDYASLETNPDSNNPEEKKPRTDIDEIINWKEKLGINKADVSTPGDSTKLEPNLVLVIKGDLIQRYPDLSIYAIKEDEKIVVQTYDPNSITTNKIIQPLFRANLGPDVVITGFPLTKKTIETSQNEYYFVLQENKDLPTFGLDAEDPNISYTENPVDMNDLSWSHVLTNIEDCYIYQFSPNLFANLDNSIEPNAASIASRTYQLPVRILYHAKKMLGLET